MSESGPTVALGGVYSAPFEPNFANRRRLGQKRSRTPPREPNFKKLLTAALAGHWPSTQQRWKQMQQRPAVPQIMAVALLTTTAVVTFRNPVQTI